MEAHLDARGDADRLDAEEVLVLEQSTRITKAERARLAELDQDPRVTLAFNLPNFLRMVTGELNGMQAFTTGKLKISGDMMFSQKLAAWFSV